MLLELCPGAHCLESPRWLDTELPGPHRPLREGRGSGGKGTAVGTFSSSSSGFCPHPNMRTTTLRALYPSFGGQIESHHRDLPLVRVWVSCVSSQEAACLCPGAGRRASDQQACGAVAHTSGPRSDQDNSIPRVLHTLSSQSPHFRIVTSSCSLTARPPLCIGVPAPPCPHPAPHEPGFGLAQTARPPRPPLCTGGPVPGVLC